MNRMNLLRFPVPLIIILACLMMTGSVSCGKVIEISASSSHSVALCYDGTVWEWGSIGIFTESVPARVQINDVKKVSAGFDHCLALKRDGTVWAWGSNHNGELGDGTTSGSLVPVQVIGLSDIKQISAGSLYSLALADDGTVWAWGGNADGRLGDGTYEDKLTPVQVGDLNNVTEIYAGINSFAITADGSLWAWGDNTYEYSTQNGYTYGLLLDNSPIRNFTKPTLLNISSVAQVAQGGQFILVLKTDGTIWAWGNNAYGQLGTGIDTNYIHTLGPVSAKHYAFFPIPVKDIDHVVSISAGNAHAMAVTNDGTAWAWGDNSVGMLGNGEYMDMRSTPTKISLNNVAQVSAGMTHSVALKADGTVWAWGDNTYNQVDGSNINKRPSPVKILESSGLHTDSTPVPGSDNSGTTPVNFTSNNAVTSIIDSSSHMNETEQAQKYGIAIDLRLVGAVLLILMLVGGIYWFRKNA